MTSPTTNRVIIAGGRDITDYNLVLEAIKNANFRIDVVVSGGAKGVDSLGERYAEENNISLTIFNADWKTHGRAAGPIRNRKMAENADALIAIWDGKSKGTKNMIETATKHNLAVYVHRLDLATLATVGAWMDEDKGYEESTQEKYEEFVKRRNYRYE